LEAFKREAVNRLDREKGLPSREQAYKESERHQEIETVLLDKHSHFERVIQDHRRENEELKRENQRLVSELGTARRDIE
jgi:hypothetical protein